MAYCPPLTVTPCIVTLISEISEQMGQLGLTLDGEPRAHTTEQVTAHVSEQVAGLMSEPVEQLLAITMPDSPRSPTQRYRRVDRD